MLLMNGVRTDLLDTSTLTICSPLAKFLAHSAENGFENAPQLPSSASNRRQVSMELSTVDNGACTECEVLSEDCGSQMLSRHAFWKICPSNVTLAMATVEVRS
jgi:hypothetical protein